MTTTPFASILKEFRKEALSERDKGDKFERLIQRYLQTEPTYQRILKGFGFGTSFLLKASSAARTWESTSWAERKRAAIGRCSASAMKKVHISTKSNYQVKKDKKSGLLNDPNDWAEEQNNPRYILVLLLSVIQLSL